MKRTWQIWVLFSLCFAAIAVAMSWLSLKVVRLDSLREIDRAETELARREAELQERISSALYRMDLKMLPLISQEAARPTYFYQTAATVIPESQWVQSYFQVTAEETVASRNEQLAVALFDFQSLLRATSEQQLNDIAATQARIPPDHSAQIAYNVPAVDNFRNQIEDQAMELPTAKASNKFEIQQSRRTQRINEEFNQRRDSTQQITQQTWANNIAIGNGFDTENVFGNDEAASLLETNQTIQMQPVWMENNLVLTRRINSPRETVIQCCWLNWEKIKADLQTEVAALLPGVEFQPITHDSQIHIGTALTTIPVQLIVDRPRMLSMLAIDSPMATKESMLSVSLIAAWCGLLLAGVCSAMLLHGVLRLSEKRAAFVSAVTHELRTPLTTFRMYSEMLAEGMVPTEKQQQYADTLKTQADRLAHLVENVLQFAKLERGPAKMVCEHVAIHDLLQRFRLRLEERVASSQMKLLIDLDESLAEHYLTTQPAAIEQILFNLVDNACKYAQTASDQRIIILVSRSGKKVELSVRDFGPGIRPADRKRMFEPFRQSDLATSNAVPGVGLGLALCDRMARSLGGRLYAKAHSGGAWFVLELDA
jgi:signal transduction histidine kinase